VPTHTNSTVCVFETILNIADTTVSALVRPVRARALKLNVVMSRHLYTTQDTNAHAHTHTHPHTHIYTHLFNTY